MWKRDLIYFILVIFKVRFISYIILSNCSLIFCLVDFKFRFFKSYSEWIMDELDNGF